MKRLCSVWVIFVIVFCIYGNARAGGSQQTSGVTAQTIIDNAREYLNEAIASFWTDARLLAHVRDGVLDIAAKTKSMEGNETINLSTGVSEYAISTSYLSIEGAVYSGATTTYNDTPFVGLKRLDIKEISRNPNVGIPVRYYVWNDKVGFDPTPGAGVSVYSVNLYLIEKPAVVDLAGTTAVPTPAIYDYALTLFVVGRALKKPNIRRALSDSFMEEYRAQLAQYRLDYVERPTK